MIDREKGVGAPPHPSFIETRRIGNANVTFFGVDHVASYPMDEIEDVVKGVDKVIVEYAPWELEEGVFKSAVLGILAKSYAYGQGIMGFFTKVAEAAKTYKKDILTLDPAIDLKFYLYEVIGPTTLIAASTPTLIYMAAMGMNAGLLEKMGEQQYLEMFPPNHREYREKEIRDYMSRRKFLKRVVPAAAVAGLEGVSPMLQNYDSTRGLSLIYRDLSLNMRDMRWVTVAQGIEQASKDIAEINLAVIYPPTHLTDGIFHYLNHPRLRAAKYALYSLVPGVTREIRRFDPQTGNNIGREKIRL